MHGYVSVSCSSPAFALCRSCSHIQNLHRGSTRTSRQEILDASITNLNSEAGVSRPITPGPPLSSCWKEDTTLPMTAIPNSYEDQSQGQLQWCRLLFTCALTLRKLIFSAAVCMWRLLPSICEAKNWVQHFKILEATLRLHGLSY